LIVGVPTDETSDALELVTDFAEEFSMNYPVMIDDGEVASLYGGNYALPTTFVIGRDGAIRHRVIGSVAATELEPVLVELLDRQEL
jgi:peroxiredoxin